MDWKNLSMQFWHDGEMVTLQGQGGKQLLKGCLNSFLEGRERDVNHDWWWPKEKKNHDQ